MTRLGIFLIGLYQKTLSPLMGRQCCFYPSCSEYARMALEKYPWDKALLLIVKRILRCHPKTSPGVEFP